MMYFYGTELCGQSKGDFRFSGGMRVMLTYGGPQSTHSERELNARVALTGFPYVWVS